MVDVNEYNNIKKENLVYARRNARNESLQEMRERVGLSLYDAADKINVVWQDLKEWENGDKSFPVYEAVVMASVYDEYLRPQIGCFDGDKRIDLIKVVMAFKSSVSRKELQDEFGEI